MEQSSLYCKVIYLTKSGSITAYYNLNNPSDLETARLNQQFYPEQNVIAVSKEEYEHEKGVLPSLD